MATACIIAASSLMLIVTTYCHILKRNLFMYRTKHELWTLSVLACQPLLLARQKLYFLFWSICIPLILSSSPQFVGIGTPPILLMQSCKSSLPLFAATRCAPPYWEHPLSTLGRCQGSPSLPPQTPWYDPLAKPWIFPSLAT